MKKLILYIGILAGFCACQQETEEIPTPETFSQEGKIPVSFSFTLPTALEYASDIVPMTRAGKKDTVKTYMRNSYIAIFTKQVGSKWVIDTIIEGQLFSKGIEVPVRDTTQIAPLKIELQPGNYKIAVFTNVGTLSQRTTLIRNTSLKKGTVVAETPDITPSDRLPAAFTYYFLEYDDNAYGNTKGSISLNREPFSGFAAFTLQKNNQLGTTATQTIPVELHRKVTRFRWILKKKPNDYYFDNTEHYLTAMLKTDNGRFCEGLNVLGGPYYSDTPLTTLKLYLTLPGSSFYNSDDPEHPADTNLYMITEDCANGAHAYNPYLLADDAVPQLPCTLYDIRMGSNSGGPIYSMIPAEKELPLTIKPNAIQGFVLVFYPGNYGDVPLNEYLMQVDPTVDVTKVFNPFFEWNTNQLNSNQ